MMHKLSYLLVIILIIVSACTDSATTSRRNAEIDALQKALSSEKKSEVAQVSDVCFERLTREEKLSCLY